MNASTFANSREAGYLVTAAVVLFMVAGLVAIWTVDRWVLAQRLSRARRLQAQRRALRQSALAAATRAERNHPRVVAGRFRTDLAKSEGDRRLKAIGVDDGFHQWAEKQR